MDVLLPELGISPILMKKMQGKKMMRVRHKKEE